MEEKDRQVPDEPKEEAEKRALERAIGRVLKGHRTLLGWSLERLANDAEMSVSKLARVEKGQQGLPLDQWARICTKLGATFTEVWDEAVIRLREEDGFITEPDPEVGVSLQQLQDMQTKRDENRYKMVGALLAIRHDLDRREAKAKGLPEPALVEPQVPIPMSKEEEQYWINELNELDPDRRSKVIIKLRAEAQAQENAIALYLSELEQELMSDPRISEVIAAAQAKFLNSQPDAELTVRRADGAVKKPGEN